MNYSFEFFLEAFKQTPVWQTMLDTVEDSPWHRETNVAVHTEMCLAQYRDRFSAFRTDEQNKIAAIALLFHDVGKPSAEEVLDKKDGSGQYRRYAGHEQESAIGFMESYVQTPALRDLLTPLQARQVKWIIEHHLPYGLKNEKKVKDLRSAMKATMGEFEETFYDCLRSDAAGRISDDHEQKLANVEEWIAAFKSVEPTVFDTKRARNMYIMVGPSGSGKTTWRRRKQEELALMGQASCVISADDSPWSCPAEEYDAAWKYCTIDETHKGFDAYFRAEVEKSFVDAKSRSAHMFIDLVNASKKKRAAWCDLARKHEYRVIGVEFWILFETLMKRKETRGDKKVPQQSLKQQMRATSSCWLGSEVEEIVLNIGDES